MDGLVWGAGFPINDLWKGWSITKWLSYRHTHSLIIREEEAMVSCNCKPKIHNAQLAELLKLAS